MSAVEINAIAEAVVAGHISLDLYPALHGPAQLEPGRLVVVGPAAFSTGGAVANVGLALHRLGVRVRLVAKVGDDLFGGAVLDALAAHDERLREGIVVAAGEATSYTIVINPPGVDRSFLHCPGANETFSAADVPYDALAGVRVFHFGYPPLMPRMYADGGAELRATLASVQAAGVATALDLCEPDPDSDAGHVDWPGVLRGVLPYVDVFAPSVDELLFMFDRATHDRLPRDGCVIDQPLLARLAGSLLAMGAAVVAIKLGDQGLYLRTGSDVGGFCRRAGLVADEWHDRELLSPCFRAREVLGTTGSGDATIAGLLAAVLRGAGPAEAATIATAVGAFSVETVDPTSAVPSLDRVRERVGAGWERHPIELPLPAGAPVERDPAGTLTLRG